MKTVMIDPGHGGKFTGAVRGEAVEKNIVLFVAKYLAVMLESRGVWVITTRKSDMHLSNSLQVDLQDRCNLEHIYRPDCFVSIHCNAHSNAAAHGFEVWTSPGETESDKLATIMATAFEVYMPEVKVRKDFSDGDPDKESRFKVLVGTKGPAVLAELGFISNTKERELLMSIDGQIKYAKTLAMAIFKYLGIEI